MGWYIKDLSDNGKQARRDSLDATGLISCLAPIFVLLGLAGIRAYQRSHKQDTFPPTISRFEWRFFYAPALSTSPELGTVGMWIGAAAYVIWQLCLGISGTNEDYIHLTKVFGTLAASNLPLHFFLAGKSRSFLHRHLIHYPYSRVNIVHRWLGRLIFTFICFHAILYLNYFWVTDRLFHILDWDIMFGVAGFIMLATIYVTSLSLIRHAPSQYFTLFYFTHIVLAIALIPTIWNHSAHPHPYLLATASFWLWDYTLRWFSTRWGHVEVKVLSGGRMLEADVLINRPERVEISPGAHIFLTIPRLHRLRGGMRTNPFVVAAFSEGEQCLKLVMRVRDGFTKSLVELTQCEEASSLSTTSPGEEQALQIPASIFLPSQAPFPNLLQYTRVLFIGGGVGGSFCVPWVKYLHAQPPTGTTVRFVWSVSDPLETHWAFSELKDAALRNFTSSLELHVTSTRGARERGEAELELLPRAKNEIPSSILAGNVRYSRPILSLVLEQELHACMEGDDMAVLVCGPEGMTADVREAVGRTIDNRKGVGVWYWEESFGY